MAGRRVLVTGGSGLLGRELMKCFKDGGWDVLGLAFSRSGGGLKKVDLKNAVEVRNVFDEFKPEVVVHSAAERRPDKMDNDLEGSRLLNVTSTDVLTNLCKEHGCFLIYMSTDYVFDGRKPPYKPDHETNPLNAYGQSKRDGEIAVRKYGNSAVLRVPILYGNVETLDESAVTVIFKAVKSQAPAKISDYEIRYPTHTADVAKAVVRIATTSINDSLKCQGVWHYSARESYTKYGMACVMGRVFGISVAHLEPVRGPTGGAPRPYNTQLDPSQTFQVFGNQSAMEFEKKIEDILKPFMTQ